MRTGWRPTLLLLLALCAAAPGAAAQRGIPALRMGDSVRATLSAADPALTEWGSYKVFRFDAAPDRAYRFTARSDSGMVALRVAKLAGVLTEYLNDTGIHRHVELRFRPPAPGPYLIVIASIRGGAFTLRGQELVPGPAVPRALPMGTLVRGALTVESGTFPRGDRDSFYELYTFSASRDQKLYLLHTGGGSASVGRLVDGNFVVLSAGTAAQSEGAVEIPEDGEYAVRIAGMLGEDEAVPYALRLVDLRARPEPRRLEVGGAVETRFDPDAAYPVGDTLMDEWVVQGTAGQRLQITARSEAFDTFLILGRMRGGQWEQLDFNDDSEGTNAGLVFEVPESGDYRIRVRPFSTFPQSAVPYTLFVEPARTTQPAVQVARRARPETRAVRWGAQLTGMLDDSDAAAEDGSPYDAWTFRAQAGDRITITMRADSLDSYLAVGRMEDGAWMELTSNDDVDGSLHARVVMVAPDTGEYVIRANTFPNQPRGAYVLTVDRR